MPLPVREGDQPMALHSVEYAGNRTQLGASLARGPNALKSVTMDLWERRRSS